VTLHALVALWTRRNERTEMNAMSRDLPAAESILLLDSLKFEISPHPPSVDNEFQPSGTASHQNPGQHRSSCLLLEMSITNDHAHHGNEEPRQNDGCCLWCSLDIVCLSFPEDAKHLVCGHYC
jgi:hypothetical protein